MLNNFQSCFVGTPQVIVGRVLAALADGGVPVAGTGWYQYLNRAPLSFIFSGALNPFRFLGLENGQTAAKRGTFAAEISLGGVAYNGLKCSDRRSTCSVCHAPLLKCLRSVLTMFRHAKAVKVAGLSFAALRGYFYRVFLTARYSFFAVPPP